MDDLPIECGAILHYEAVIITYGHHPKGVIVLVLVMHMLYHCSDGIRIAEQQHAIYTCSRYFRHREQYT
jgi:hypothetical protein